MNPKFRYFVPLDGKVPVPPKGVFVYVRTHQKEAVTWEPRKEVVMPWLLYVSMENIRDLCSQGDRFAR